MLKPLFMCVLVSILLKDACLWLTMIHCIAPFGYAPF